MVKFIGNLETKIVTGNCPECKTNTMLVSFDDHVYRCVNCGHDLEQKVNGVIKYVIADDKTAFSVGRFVDEDDHG